jgi:hypothetical protein
MADAVMASHAVEILLALVGYNSRRANEFAVASPAVFDDNRSRRGVCLYRLMKILQGKRPGVQKPIFHFLFVLGDELVREVAVVTGRGGVMRGFLP